MNRITKYALIGTGIILLLVLLTLEKTEIYETNAVVTVVDDQGNKIGSLEDLELQIEFKHPDEEIEQKVAELFETEFQKSKTLEAEPAESLNAEATPQH